MVRVSTPAQAGAMATLTALMQACRDGLSGDSPLPTAVKTARKAAAAAIQRRCQRRTRATASSVAARSPRSTSRRSNASSTRSRAASLVELARHTFNFGVLGEAGFDRLGHLVRNCGCFDFSYSKLDDALKSFDHLFQAA